MIQEVVRMSLGGVGSLLRYVSSEVTRSYMLEHDQERYTSKREKMYTFMRIPRSENLTHYHYV